MIILFKTESTSAFILYFTIIASSKESVQYNLHSILNAKIT